MARRKLPNTISRTDTNTYKDLRSARRQRNRQSTQSDKYYGYRGVHPSWVGKPYIKVHPRSYNYPWVPCNNERDEYSFPLVTQGVMEGKVATWTKRDMFYERESNIWPLDRRHHAGKKIREKRSFKYDEQAMGRRMKQRSAEWGFALEEAVELASELAGDVDTVYWELEERAWDGAEEVWNEWGEKVIDQRFEDCGFDDEEEEFVVDGAGAHGEDFDDVPLEDVICVEPIDIEEMEYFFVLGQEDDAVLMWSAEDEYEMVEAG